MKICMFVLNNMTLDSRVLREAKALAGTGHNVVVFAVLDDKTVPYEERDGFIIKRIRRRYVTAISQCNEFMRKVGRVILAPFSPLGFLAKKFLALLRYVAKAIRVGRVLKQIARVIARRLMIRPTQLQDWTRKFIFKQAIWLVDPHHSPGTVQAAIQERADVYHAHDLTTLRMAYLAAKACHAKLVYDSHELYLERNPIFLDHNPVFDFRLSRREAKLIKKAAAVITVNEAIASEFSRRYRIPKPHVIMNAPPQGNNLNPLLLRRKLEEELQVRLPEHAKIVIYIGGITAHHGLEQVIQSLRYLTQAALVIMGYGYGGTYMDRLKALAEEQRVLGQTYFLSPVPSEEVSTYASGADVGVVPIQNACLSYYYCSPNKLFECIAGNIPVAVSDFPEMRRIVQDHDIGKTFNPKDPQDIARAIHDILKDPKRYQEMKRNTQRAAATLNWENESKKLLAIYQSLQEELHA